MLGRWRSCHRDLAGDLAGDLAADLAADEADDVVGGSVRAGSHGLSEQRGRKEPPGHHGFEDRAGLIGLADGVVEEADSDGVIAEGERQGATWCSRPTSHRRWLPVGTRGSGGTALIDRSSTRCTITAWSSPLSVRSPTSSKLTFERRWASIRTKSVAKISPGRASASSLAASMTATP